MEPALLAEVWAARHREPARMLPLGRQIVERFGFDARLRSHGWLHMAWGHHWVRAFDERDEALATARRGFDALADAPGQANCRDLDAVILNGQRRYDESLQLVQGNRKLPDHLRHGYERYVTERTAYAAHTALNQPDDALRTLYRLQRAARDSGDAAAIATALGLLASTHGDQCNLDDAERLAEEACTLAEQAEATQAWKVASMCLLQVLIQRGDAEGARALAIARRWMALDHTLRPGNQEENWILFAEAHLRAGEVDRAQGLLDESVALRQDGRARWLDYTAAQAEVWLARGMAADARRITETYLAYPPDDALDSERPADALRVRRAAARACEELGDLAAALRHEREANRWQEAQVGRAARARRLVLEIEHDLERERWQRGEAERRRHDAEQERIRLDGLNAELRAANEAKTRFLAAASHDLRQPAQAMAMFLAALQRETTATGRRELMARMEQSMSALGSMFDVLLDVSRLDAGVVPVRREPLDLRALLQRLHHEQAERAAAQGLAWRLQLPSSATPAFAFTDAVLFERIVRNLLDNALKYTPRGAVWLRLRATPAAADAPPRWRIEVRDTGPGIAPELQARVFEEFFQLDNAERDRRKGLGLGLAIAQRGARLLGQPIGLRSQPGSGCRFWIDAPVVAAPEPAAADAPAGTGPAITLMVVDDDDLVRQGLVALVRRWGHQVLEGPDTEAVLAAWQLQGKPAVQGAIVDMRLAGGRDGLQALAALRQATGAALPALVVTGDIGTPQIKRLDEAGQPWLSKPVMPLRLRSWLQTLPVAVR